jgi:glycosyltransferase involved in cell wall biosynthesis
MASDNEGISNALLEAAVLGSALVSTRAGGAEEVLMDRDNCLLADPGSSSQIAGCLQLLYRDPALRLHLAERAFRMVNETFSMKRMTDEMIDFFNSITGR